MVQSKVTCVYKGNDNMKLIQITLLICWTKMINLISQIMKIMFWTDIEKMVKITINNNHKYYLSESRNTLWAYGKAKEVDHRGNVIDKITTILRGGHKQRYQISRPVLALAITSPQEIKSSLFLVLFVQLNHSSDMNNIRQHFAALLVPICGPLHHPHELINIHFSIIYRFQYHHIHGKRCITLKNRDR